MYFIFLKRNKSIWVKVLFLYVVYSLLNDTMLLSLDSSTHRDTIYYLLSSFTLIEYTVFSYVLYTVIENRTFRLIILISSAAFYVSTILLTILFPQTSFDSLSASIESILIVSYSVFYLFEQMNKPHVIFIYQEPHFWFVVGFIIYFSGSLFLFIQASNLDREIRDNFWKITLFLTIAKNILFAIAFSTRKSKTLDFSRENPFDDDILENPYKS